MPDLPSSSFLRGSDIAQPGSVIPRSGGTLLPLETSLCLDWAPTVGVPEGSPITVRSHRCNTFSGPGPWKAEMELAGASISMARMANCFITRALYIFQLSWTSTIQPHTSLNSSARRVCVAGPPLPP